MTPPSYTVASSGTPSATTRISSSRTIRYSLAIQLDLRARVLPDEHVIACCLHVQRNRLTVVGDAAAADGYDCGLLRLLFGCVGDDDPADLLLLRLDPLDEDAISQPSRVHMCTPSLMRGFSSVLLFP